MPDLTKLQFYSGNNYLKRSEFFGQMNAVVNSASAPNTTSIAHNLGYIPQFITAIDYQNNSIWWANEFCGPLRATGGANDDVITVNPMVDNNNLYLVSSTNYSGSISSATRPAKYGIYLDS